MADKSKPKKTSLSAARKMLKEYQQNQTKPKSNQSKPDDAISDTTSPVPGQNEFTPVDSLVSSTHSSINPIQDINNLQTTDNNIMESFTPQNEIPDVNQPNYFNNALFQTTNNHLLSNYFSNTTEENDINNHNYNENTTEADNINYAEETMFQNDEKTPPVFNYKPVEEPEVETMKPSAFLDDVSTPKINYSNTESLRQLSSQLTSLIEAETLPNVNQNSELERRNQELASLLENERLKSEQLNLQIREYVNRVTHLETESQQLKNEHDVKLSREIGPLQEQLQYHVQTVGILVGEKTELTMSLNQSQATLKQKTSECEELQGRLRASRHRVSELEKEINSLKSVKDNVNKTEEEFNREIERFKSEYKLLKEQYNDLQEECTEFKDKLVIKTNETTTLQKELHDKSSVLSLAELRIQQLTVGENLQTESQLEVLNQQKIALEQQVAEFTQTIKLVSSERDQASQQYQHYVQQLNGQLQNLATQLQAKSIDNDNLAKREQSLVSHISELEKRLQQVQIEPPVVNQTSPIVKELENNIKDLERQQGDMKEKHKAEVEKRESLEKELLENRKIIEGLEFKCERLMVDQPDAGKLLAAMESDKVAASRATEQNQMLKQQLTELQDGFVKMSNSKLELTEKLESEEHHCRELNEKLTQNVSNLEHLQLAVNVKDREIIRLEQLKEDLNKQVLQQNQLLDRLRHYEAQGNVMDMLQHELKEANTSLQSLTSENTELHKIIEELEHRNTDVVDTNKIETIDPASDSLTESIRRKIELLEDTNTSLEKQIKDMTGNSEEYLDKEKAMDKLEERFTKTMEEVAELTDEKQRLEHLVMQLQSETETIGEYVTLYQCQRAMLKQKTMEKDEQLARLSKDREDMKIKLDELNNLIRKLVSEKDNISDEIINSKLINSYNYCDVHKENEDDKVLNGENKENNNIGTAGKIIALLSEIKTSSLVQAGDNIQNFHPCPCCSGKLITV